jgi:adenosylhomocysteine nucleosidase
VRPAPATRGIVIAVTGLRKEARIAAGPGVRAIAAGGDARQLQLALEREISFGAKAVISFGIAGGLVDDVVSGDCLLADAVVTADDRWPCDSAWTRALAERLPDAVAADLAGVDTLVMDASARRKLHRATGATAVDTESHIAASIAARHALPFAAFRVVCDSVRRGLPPAASGALSKDGRVDGAAVLVAVAKAPRQLPALARTALDARSAFRALLRGRRFLGPGLGYPDLGELLLELP